MKAATFVFLLAVCGVVMRAQSSAAQSADVTIGMSEDTPEFCLGEILSPPSFGILANVLGPKRGPDDITLRLPLKLQYENHRSETIILPNWIHTLTRMTVAEQNGSTVLRNVGNGGMDVKRVMAMSSPDPQFSIIAGGKYAWYTGLEGVVIPVLDRSSGLDLRGKTVQIVMTRDFRSLAPEVVEKLNEKWKDYGTIWTGVAESETLTFRIPEEPLTRNCITLVAR
jgi:hypothetical protein